MFETIKQKFFAYLSELGYNVGDNWVMRDQFPHLNLRVNGGSFSPTRGAREANLTLTVDIFSTYPGEKEVLQIIEYINDHLLDFVDANPEIIHVNLSNFIILDDKETGPVRKHGVASYRFTLARGDE